MFEENIKELAKENSYFRHVLYTGAHSQLVVMSIAVGEDIGEETHEGSDQIFVIVDGDGKAVLNGEGKLVQKHDVIFVQAGTRHNIINTGNEALKLYTIYAPSVHKDGIIHKTKADATGEETY